MSATGEESGAKAAGRKGRGENDAVVIKKYANRRLYNTATSSYVTLDYLADMVKNGQEFVVYDAKTNDDITHSVLTQIIFEEENKEGQSLLPISVLRQLIRIYGDSMQAVVPHYLEMSMDNLLKQQSEFRQQMAKNLGLPGFEALEKQAQANMRMFTEAFRMFNPFMAADKQEAEKPPATRPKDDIEGLRAELSAMREKLDKLSGKG